MFFRSTELQGTVCTHALVYVSYSGFNELLVYVCNIIFGFLIYTLDGACESEGTEFLEMYIHIAARQTKVNHKL